MALYSKLGGCSPFGQCAGGCDAVYPAEPTSGPEPAPVPGFNISAEVPGASTYACPRTRWWLWLAVGLGLGYLANE